MWKTLPSLAVSIAVGVVIAGGALTMIGSIANARPMRVDPAEAQSSSAIALERAYTSLTNQGSVSEEQVRKAISVVEEQLAGTNMRSSRDFYLAAQIAVKGSTAEDALLAHDLACCALVMGERESKSIVATALDQYLTRTGCEQRFGTQPDGKAVNKTVTDGMRFIMGVKSRSASNDMQTGGPKKALTLQPVARNGEKVKLNTFVGN